MAFDIAAAQNLGFATTADEVAKKVKAGADLGQDAFLKLLTTQLTHQDPTKPMDNGDFIAQLAQFSTVEGISSLGTSFDKFADAMTSDKALDASGQALSATGKALDASGLVGHAVSVSSNQALLGITEDLKGVATLPAGTEQLIIDIVDSNGKIVHQIAPEGYQPAGDFKFSWNGEIKEALKDDEGNVILNDEGKPVQPAVSVDPGLYTINANALLNGTNTAIATSTSAKVESVVLLNNQQNMSLHLGQLGAFDFTKVQQIF